MEFFSFRNFLELTMQLSMVPMALGFVLFLSWVISAGKGGDYKWLTFLSKGTMLLTGASFMLGCTA
ncbi:MAG: hypothetical protein ACKVJZ_08825, partial [Planctomycetota bacterium]